MMPKEALLKENSPVKKQFEVPVINSPNMSAMNNNLFNVSTHTAAQERINS